MSFWYLRLSEDVFGFNSGESPAKVVYSPEWAIACIIKIHIANNWEVISSVGRKREVSFDLKAIIWELAATTGNKPVVIQRQLDTDPRLGEMGLHEGTPDVRTIKRIIEKDINELVPEVVLAKLGPHLWHLREDYEDLKLMASKATSASPHMTKLMLTASKIESNMEKLRNDPAVFSMIKAGKIGKQVLGGPWIGEQLAKLDMVDRTAAAQLLSHLKNSGEFPELKSVRNWSMLGGTQFTDDLIHKLRRVASSGVTGGFCSGCES